jgi:hypothetical protein
MHVPPPSGFEPDMHKLPRSVRRAFVLAAGKALKSDRKFFQQNPLRLTRVRPAVDGEHYGRPSPAGLLVVVRRVQPDGYHNLFFNPADPSAPLPDFSSERAAAEMYDLLLEPDQVERAERVKQQALAALLAAAPAVGGRA